MFLATCITYIKDRPADIQSFSLYGSAPPYLWTARASTQSSRQTVVSFYRHQWSSGATGQGLNRQ